MFASLEQKEKLFEDDSESRAGACPENDFSFGDVICAQHGNRLFTVHFSCAIYSFVCPLTRTSCTLSKSGEGKLNSCIIRMELQKEKLFEDNSVS